MSQLLEMPSTKAKKKKYGHDLSQLLKFTSSCGHLLPVFYDFALPGDKYKMNTQMFTQLTDIVSPAMMKITEHVEWFFIPLKQISQVAGDALYGISDIKTTLLPSNIAVENIIPLGDMHKLSSAVFANGDWADVSYSFLDPEFLDEYGVYKRYNAIRLMELLGFPPQIATENFVEQTQHIYFNPMLLCCYQKIFFDNYRLTDRTPNDASFYNLDLYARTGYLSDATDYIYEQLFTIHYRSFARDFFQITFPAPLIDKGDIGMLDKVDSNDSLVQYNKWLGIGTVYNNDGRGASAGDDALDKSVSAAGANYPLNTSLIRGMFAVEKLMEITRRAAKRYEAQTLAHFGVKVPEGISDKVYKIGEESSIIQINEVISQSVGSAEVDGEQITSTLGERGGKGASYSPAGRNIRFTAPCHGIIMAVYSAIPEADYEQEGIDRLNTYAKREDYPIPSLDNMGMQPLFNYQVVFSSNPSANAGIIGWQYRWQELKLKYNRCCGAFNSTYDNWTVKRHNAFSLAQDFYVNPQFMDNILLLTFQNGEGDIMSYENCFARDPMLHWFKFNVFKSSVLSTYSLPKL